MDTVRAAVTATLDRFIEGWRQGDASAILTSLDEKAMLHSSAHGIAKSAVSIASLLAMDFATTTPQRLVTTNVYVAGDESSTTTTAYLYGVFENATGGTETVFSAVLLADARYAGASWVFTGLKLDISLAEGNRERFADWKLPVPGGWQVGDDTPTIISEIDSPWARGITPLSGASPEQQISDAFTRYAWAIDQGDISLLISAYDPDASGEFTPMGHREGRRDIIGQQKAFRRHWPVMQHFARQLSVTFNTDASAAQVIVGRAIPQRDQTADGHQVYGAHYRLEFVADAQGWRIRHFDYRPGWLTAAGEAEQ